MSLLQMSCTGAIMILVILAVRGLFMHKIPKKAFLALWCVALLRLLVPFSLPSPWSAYSLLEQSAPLMDTLQTTAAADLLPMASTGLTVAGPDAAGPSLAHHAVAGSLWLAGALLCGLFFTLTYIRCRREFRMSLPVDNEFITRWLQAHPLRRRVSVRQFSRIAAPLTFGIVHPVILLPKTTDWADTGSLRFVLTHEFIHIRRFDAAAKLLLAAALCIHWFNPLVWVLYVLANRDMELACDEEVIRQAGQQEKAAYALTLIHMEEKKSRLMPLCNNFSKSAIQGRITSIMKTRRASVITALAAAALVLAVSAAFATSASGQHALRPIPGTAFTQGEYEQLLALQLDGYQDMTVAQYRERVWEATDTAAYGELLQRFSQDEQLYGMKDQNETAAFLFYLLEPLTAQRLDHRYGGYTRTDLPGAAEQASLEYDIDLSIQDPDGLTVRQYCEARVGMMRGIQALLQGKTPAELQDQAAMDAYLQKEVSRLTEAWRSDALHIEASYFYTPYTPAEDPGSRSTGPAEQEPRVFGPGTAADYRSLLALQTPGYRDMPLAAFNDTVLQWANEDYDRMERINEDVARGSYGVPLTEAEQAFVSLTVRASGIENAQQIKSIQTGQPALDPGFAEDFPLREEGSQGAAWCSFYYQFSYHIPDAARITVGQRDSSLLGMLGTARDLWSRSTLDELLQLTEGDIRTMLRTAAAENSSELITLHIDENQVIFEHNDERDRV